MVGAELKPTLENLRACRKRDPNFERAIAEFIEAEVTAQDDPAEGHIVAPASPTDAAPPQTLKK